MVPWRLERFTAPGSVGDLAYPRMVSEKEKFARSRFAGFPALWCAFCLLRGILAPFSFCPGLGAPLPKMGSIAKMALSLPKMG